MARHSFAFMGFVLIVCFAVFFGIELATRGIVDIQGPVSNRNPAEANIPAATQPNTQQPVQQPVQQPTAPQPQSQTQQRPAQTAPVQQQPPVQQPAAQQYPAQMPGYADSGVNRVGNQIGDVLQTVAHGTIRTVVTFLDQFVN